VSNALVANWQKLSGQPAKLVLLDANTTDPTPEVSSALATNPDAMIVGVVGTLGQTVVEKLAARGVKIPLYGGIASSARFARRRWRASPPAATPASLTHCDSGLGEPGVCLTASRRCWVVVEIGWRIGGGRGTTTAPKSRRRGPRVPSTPRRRPRCHRQNAAYRR
jgi:hypothetical protein